MSRAFILIIGEIPAYRFMLFEPLSSEETAQYISIL